MDLTVEDLTSKSESLGLNILGVDQNLIEDQYTNEYHEVIILPNSRYVNMSVKEFNERLPENISVKAITSDKEYEKNPNMFIKFFSKKFIYPGNRVLLTGNLREIQKIASIFLRM